MPDHKDEPDLHAALARIISHPSTPPELAACARALAAADEHFSFWFGTTAKKYAVGDQLMKILAGFDREYWQVAGACVDYEASGYRDPEQLCRVLSSMSAQWHRTIEETTFPPARKE